MLLQGGFSCDFHRFLQQATVGGLDLCRVSFWILRRLGKLGREQYPGRPCFLLTLVQVSIPELENSFPLAELGFVPGEGAHKVEFSHSDHLGLF